MAVDAGSGTGQHGPWLCYLYFSDIARLPVVTVSILGYLEPMSAVFFAVLLLHERLSALELAGALLILAGAAVTERLRAE